MFLISKREFGEIEMGDRAGVLEVKLIEARGLKDMDFAGRSLLATFFCLVSCIHLFINSLFEITYT